MRFLIWLMFPFFVSASTDDRGSVKVLMHSFLIEMSAVNDILADEKTFATKEGKEKVKDALAKMERYLRKPPKDLQDKPGFRITYGLLSDHIAKTKLLIEKGELEYARARLNGTTNLCAGCHMQTPKITKFSPFAPLKEQLEKHSFASANFLFITRRYEDALEQFNVLIRKYPESGLATDRLSEVYRKKLAFFARVQRDAGLAISNLKEDLKNKNLPKDIQQNVKDWIGSFEKWKSEKKDPATLSTPDLIAYASQELPQQPIRNIAAGDPQLVKFLRISGLLYERLYSEPDSAQAQALLYYLAQCERSLSPHYWYSLNEVYLKECVTKYPKQSFSKRCFEAYKAGMEERFMGRPMPEPIRDSIAALKDAAGA